MALHPREWALIRSLQDSKSKKSIKRLSAEAEEFKSDNCSDKSFQQTLARDLRRISKITGEVDITEVKAENDKGGHCENAYSWKAGSTALMANTLTTAQSVALGVLQKVGIGLVPKALVHQLSPLFTAVHKNELLKAQPEKNLGKKIPNKVVHAAEKKWLNKIAVLSETVGFVTPKTNPEVEMTVHEGLYSEKALSIVYKGEEFVIKPLALVQRGARRYLVAFKRRQQTAENFTIARIEKARESIIDYDEGEGAECFDLGKHLKRGVAHPVFKKEELGNDIDLVLWVDDGTFNWIKETPLDESQTATKVTDGYELTIKTTLREELVFWILSMANHVRVISPKVLKDRVAKDLQSAAKMYSN